MPNQRLETLIVLAVSAPPEISSDVLMSLASSNLIPDKRRKIELIDEAYAAAAKSREPVKRRSFSRTVDTLDDLRPGTLGPNASETKYWATPKARDLLTRAQGLRWTPGEGRHEFTEKERQTEEWQQMFHDFLALLNDWDAATEQSEEDYFQQKCVMYGVVVELGPDDVERDLVLRAYGNYLKEGSQKYKGSIDWIRWVKDYLRRLRSKTDKVRQSSLDPWISSSDPNLRIYGELALLTLAKS